MLFIIFISCVMCLVNKLLGYYNTIHCMCVFDCIGYVLITFISDVFTFNLICKTDQGSYYTTENRDAASQVVSLFTIN